MIASSLKGLIIRSGKAYFQQRSREILTKYLTKYIQDHMSKTISTIISQFIVTQIEQNADKLLQHGNAKQITRFILNKLFKGLGDQLI
jgi:hypothetical protein